jgi:oxaloacetate decarboxylase gamma subunit
MQSTLFDQAIELLIFGMGTVYVFLILLVIAVNWMSRFIENFFPEPAPLEVPIKKIKEPAAEVDKTTLAVIQAAIRQHREKQTRAVD